MLFDLGSQIDVATMLLEHGGVGIAKAPLVGAGGDVEQVDAVLQLLGNGHPVLQGVAPLKELGAAHAELNGEAGTHRLPHRLQHPAGKAAAVGQRAAVLVGAVVEVGGEKLVDEPAVAAVDHDHLKASPLGKARGAAVGGYNVVDHLHGELAHLHPVGTGAGGGAPLGKAVLSALVGHVSTGVHTGVAQLHAGDGTVAANGVGGISKGGQGVENGGVQMVGMGAVGLGMDHTLTDGHRARAALGTQLVKGGGFGADAAVVGDVGAAHGGGKDPIAERDPPNGDGLA